MKTPRALIACECSGTVRNAFNEFGFEAFSCDVKADEHGSNMHFQCDVREMLELFKDDWDFIMVAHPPCTRLCNSGVRWLTKPPATRQPDYPAEYEAWDENERLAYMWAALQDGADLFADMLNAPARFVAVENPVMHKHAKARIRGFVPHTQSVQPWQFGTDPNGPDNEKKRTCLWLRELPALVPTGTLDGTCARNSIHHASPGADRATERSRFFPGIARAMADQWGAHVVQQLAA